MPWIYLSPHFDDAAYSCGGLIWEQGRQGESVEIWTVCAGDPPPGPFSPFTEAIHQRWGTGREAVAARRAEDETACRILGTTRRLFDLPDCIYRRLPGMGEPVIQVNEDLFAPLREEELPLVDRLSQAFTAALPGDAKIVCPLTLGGHMDHRLVRAAAEQLNRPLWYYADFPYVILEKIDLSGWVALDWKEECSSVSRVGLSIWQQAVATYRSQLSTFWKDETQMQAQMEAYWRKNRETSCLWKRSVFSYQNCKVS